MARAPSIVAAIQQRFASGRFARHVGLLAGSTAIAQGTTILVAPILTRLYTPADLGILGIFLSFVLTAAVVVAARYDVAVVSTHEREEAGQLVWASLLMAIPLTAAATAVAWSLIRFRLLGFDSLPLYILPVIAAAVLITSIFTTLRYWFIREESFGVVSRIGVYQGTTRSLSQVLFGLLHPGSIGLIGGDVLGRLVGIGRMVRDAFAPVRDFTKRFSFGPALAAMKKYREFPLYSMPSAIIDTVALNLAIPLVAQLFGASAAGEFTLVQRLLGVPMVFISNSVADAFHGRAAALARDEPAQVRTFFLRTVRLLFLSGVLPLLAVALVGPFVFGRVFGERWAEAGLLAAIMTPAALAQLTVSPVTRIVLVLKRGLRLKLVYDVLSLSIVVGVLTFGHRAGWSVYTTLAFYSGAQVVAYFVYFLLLLSILPPRETPQSL